MDWFADESAVSAFIDENILEKLFQEGSERKNIVHIPNFLPLEVADAVAAELEHLCDWEVADSGEYVGAEDGIQYRFKLKDILDTEGEVQKVEEKRGSVLRSVGNVFWRMWGDSRSRAGDEVHFSGIVPNFTAACYQKNDFIAPHDDFVLERYTDAEVEDIRDAYRQVGRGSDASSEEGCSEGGDSADLGESGESIHDSAEETIYEREYALVYYLNRNWKRSFGGEFVDLETGETTLPKFNTLVLFRVPRMHAVNPVRKQGARRFSIFGWWLRAQQAAELPAAQPCLQEGHVLTGEVTSRARDGARPDKRPKVDDSPSGNDGRNASKGLPTKKKKGKETRQMKLAPAQDKASVKKKKGGVKAAAKTRPSTRRLKTGTKIRVRKKK